MSKIYFGTATIFTLSLLFFAGCNSNNLTKEFKLDKKYWNLEDYESAVHKIRYIYSEEIKPGYSTPDKMPIFKKLVNTNNLEVVLEDEELGTKYRAEFASSMFDVYRDMVGAYNEIDREDKFIYPLELVDVLQFGLYLQLHYFYLGNQQIVHGSDDPNASNVKTVIVSNEQTLVGNYNLYLDYVKQEKSFTSEALNNYTMGIDRYFPLILKTFPKANYHKMKVKASSMMNRAESERLKTSLTKLVSLLEQD